MSISTLSETQTFEYAEYSGPEGVDLEFRLVYKGKLPAASASTTRNVEKHAIRKVLHPQMRAFWEQNPYLKTAGMLKENGEIGYNNLADVFALKYERCGCQFVPLITREFGLACAIDILFLRRDNPGNLVRSGGDIDNRIKVLFDALRIPQTCDEVDGQSAADDEKPFFCLLEDDSLITRVNITTDQLLLPLQDREHQNDVYLVVHVKVIVVDSRKAPMVFYG